MKKYRRVMSHDTEEWCKVWRKTNCWFQKSHEVSGEFSSNHEKVWKFYFNGLFLSKVYKVWAKKYRWAIFHDTEQWCNYLSWHWRVMQNLHFENLHFDVLLLSMAHKVSVKKVQKNHLPCHWSMIQTLKKNWLFDWKMTWEIWWVLTWAIKILKICILKCYFCQ